MSTQREAPPSDCETLAPLASQRLEIGALETIPGYEILSELGRGGMGVVYKAHQKSLNRIVALKMILAGSHATEAELARFLGEAEAVARVQHVNIVQIYEVGRHADRPFFTLEFVSGGSLARKLADGPLTGRAAAGLVEQLARGMAFAHSRGVVHRDLKPANVLLGEDGVAKVTDFGVAKFLGAAGQTQTGQILGTPSYMAPEQAIAGSSGVGPAADVYALGAILYECLTGRPPFRAPTPLDTLLQVVEQEVAPPRLLNPRIDRDIETICLKCLEKNPQRRYADMTALADDLRLYQSGEPISARSVNVVDRLSRLVRQSQLGAEYHAWSRLLYYFAAVIIAIQIGLWIVLRNHAPVWWVRGIQMAQFPLMAIPFWQFRAHRMLPSSASERSLWAIWVGYLMACMLIAAVSSRLVGMEPLYDGFLYPYWAVATGAAFFTMGSSYWGRCYLFGLAFFALAGVLTFLHSWSPLPFGVLWFICLVQIGRHLGRLAVAK